MVDTSTIILKSVGIYKYVLTLPTGLVQLDKVELWADCIFFQILWFVDYTIDGIPVSLALFFILILNYKFVFPIKETKTYNCSYITEQREALHKAAPYQLPTTIKLQKFVQKPSQCKCQHKVTVLMIAIHYKYSLRFWSCTENVRAGDIA